MRSHDENLKGRGVRTRSLAIVVLVILIVSPAASQEEGEKYKNISVQEAYEIIRKDTSIVLLDVRTMPEFLGELGHLQGAYLIPIQELEERVGELEAYKDKTIIVYCRSGRRSSWASTILNTRGFKVLNIEGGMLKWNAEKLPVVKEKKNDYGEQWFRPNRCAPSSPDPSARERNG
ncbi:MAG: rhodanese-like domain-containing protein [Bacteroidota bacterium]